MITLYLKIALWEKREPMTVQGIMVVVVMINDIAGLEGCGW